MSCEMGSLYLNQRRYSDLEGSLLSQLLVLQFG